VLAVRPDAFEHAVGVDPLGAEAGRLVGRARPRRVIEGGRATSAGPSVRFRNRSGSQRSVAATGPEPRSGGKCARASFFLSGRRMKDEVRASTSSESFSLAPVRFARTKLVPCKCARLGSAPSGFAAAKAASLHETLRKPASLTRFGHIPPRAHAHLIDSAVRFDGKFRWQGPMCTRRCCWRAVSALPQRERGQRRPPVSLTSAGPRPRAPARSRRSRPSGRRAAPASRGSGGDSARSSRARMPPG
jgi:hypothetical protein